MSETGIELDEAIAELELLADRRRLVSVRDVLSRALPLYPDSVSLLRYSAWVDWMEDQLDDALRTVEQILAIEPDDYGARRLQADILREKQQFAAAEQTILSLLAEYPEDADSYALYGQIMLETFHVEKAEALANEALRIEPGHVAAMNVHVLCAFIDSPGDEQKRRLQKFLVEHPDHVVAAIRLAQMLIDQGRHQEAYELVCELVRAQPDDQGLVEFANSLRQVTHWSLWPLRPMQKWGWGASVAIWFAAVGLFQSNILAATPLGPYENAIALGFFAYVIYSWIWPPILARLLR